MISPSPTSGNSACRICGVLRSKLSCSAMKACATVSGLLQTNTRRLSSAGREELVFEALVLEHGEEVAARRGDHRERRQRLCAGAPDTAGRSRSSRRACGRGRRRGKRRAPPGVARVEHAVDDDRGRARAPRCRAAARAPLRRSRSHSRSTPRRSRNARRRAAGSAGGRRRRPAPPACLAVPARRRRICSISSERFSPSR